MSSAAPLPWDGFSQDPRRPESAALRASATPQQLHEWAVDAWRAQRRKAASGVVVTTLVFTTIWAITGLGWYWPVFVILAAAINLVRVQLGRRDLVAEELRRLGEQQRTALDDHRSGS